MRAQLGHAATMAALLLACESEPTGSRGDDVGAGGDDVVVDGGAGQPPVITSPDAGAAGASGNGGANGAQDGAATDRADAAGPPPGDAGGQSPGAMSAGCGSKNAGGMFIISAGSAQTPYRVVLPTGYDPGKPYPLVFYLHGRGNGIEGQGNLNRDVAGANLGIVAYPKSFGGSGWEVPGRDRPEENLALLRALIQHLGNQYCIDRKKVIVTGFSSGCWFASRLACTMKDELAAVVAAACGLDPMGMCADRKPVTYIIGRGDAAFGRAPAAAEFYRTRNGCMTTRKPTMPAPCESHDGCAAGFPTTYCAHPGGHQWPGFAAQAVVDMLRGL